MTFLFARTVLARLSHPSPNRADERTNHGRPLQALTDACGPDFQTSDQVMSGTSLPSRRTRHATRDGDGLARQDIVRYRGELARCADLLAYQLGKEWNGQIECPEAMEIVIRNQRKPKVYICLVFFK